MDISAFHLPPGTLADVTLHPVPSRDGVRVLAPALTAADVVRVFDVLADARTRLLDLPQARIIDAIDAAARALREDRQRQHAVAALAAVTGYSAPMTNVILERMSHDWLAESLHQLLRSEFGDPRVLDSFVRRRDSGRRVRAVSTDVALHVFSGNVPGIAVTSIVRSLLVRTAVLGKTAAAEPVLAPLFARLLADADPDVGACVAVTWWRGGNTELENAALQRAGMVVHYGGAEAIASLRRRAPDHVQFVEHGPRISFVVVQAECADLSRAARDTADAVAMFDQQGCVSPQLAYIIGGVDAARSFAAGVAARLRELAPTLPRVSLDAGEATAIRELRTRAEFRAIAGEDVELFHDTALDWTVVLDSDHRFEGSCLNRTLIVKRVESLDALITVVGPFRQLLQTVGLAGFEGDELVGVAAALAEAGITRIAAIDAMPWPPMDWHHDGRGPLRELVGWVDLELS
jgi:acyl-CoA reductase-like NAD-dependent aldehyde dehydrogenase